MSAPSRFSIQILYIIDYVDNLLTFYNIEMDRVGFEPTTSAMPMPYPTRLDDRPIYHRLYMDINIFKLKFIKMRRTKI
jgi:hypothetical protein